MLLDDVVARQPGEVEPVAHLVFHLAPLGIAPAVPERAGEVVLVHGDDIADGPVLDSLHRLADAVVVAPAEAGDEVQALLLGGPGRFQHVAHAGRVDRHRLLAEDVLAGRDRRLEVVRAEMGRRAEQDHVDVGRHYLLVGVEADEAVIVGHVHLVAEVDGKLALGRLDLVGKGVGQHGQLRVLVGPHRVDRRPLAASAAADQRDLDGIVARRVDGPGPQRRRQRPPPPRRLRWSSESRVGWRGRRRARFSWTWASFPWG